ncbi:ABC transporter ATP-binding protein [Thermococcus thioreducens]|uniref:Carbohydrate ABC transporter ATP-binding protein, CUT1 family n=1 Tax=Thermococcus thioreducens TaxID=277988 RepID=A0A0Q2XNT5_9EURY|nr:ABC transporter ATP-binding protein [Thermococcus thioreducens]ASJ13029.1 sugar ABC transporter ATP-binding protein [Thermococcus thioreducens]KQH82924.1 sugar ABC transporter ATP-binding protein [Thermococcus thioreducens]SEV82125.1 carbohydrate ABC transporter ATP-binding protein, CUT1 family [Thermococcus thioreducens]
MVEVKLDRITKRFGSFEAVKELSLKIDNGEFLVLLGPSGCGKTTTLRMISGLETPTEGRIYFGDRDVTYLPPKDRNISMVFQSYAVWPHMKVFDNIAFPLKVKKYPEDEIRRRVKWAAELLQIEELLDRYPGQLSGGQRQRVAVARAIVVEPDVLLMDEPLSNLDAKLRVAMRAEIKKLQTKLKVTTIYVTHDQVEAMTMGDRIAVMNQGRLLQVGPPTEVYLKPNSLFVATFIGAPEMNILDASLVENEGIALEGDGFRIPLPEDFRDILLDYLGKDVLVGIRPEHMTVKGVSTLEHVTRSVEIDGVVDFIEALGTDTIVHAKVGGSIIKIKLPGHIPLPIGEKIKIEVDLDNLHIFDKTTEKAII